MKQAMKKRSFLITAILLVAACGSTQQPVTLKMETFKCPEVRPEICTMDYNPVCGISSDGSFKTYSNSCNACTDPKVTSYYLGVCK
jgi:hypothetical protein